MRRPLAPLLSSTLAVGVARTRREVGHLPILPASRLFVAEGENRLDDACVGLDAAMAARADGVGLEGVASALVGQEGVVVEAARGDLRDPA